ncbi:MAG: polysaccharide biosynthesis C-terminal domain-containing protein [Flavobacteriales bacterium]
MKKSFLLNILLLVFLNLLIKPLWVFIEVEVQNKAGIEQYGLYFALFNLSLILNMILDGGIVNFNNKKIAEKPFLANQYFNKIIPLRFILGVIYLVVVLATAIALGYNTSSILLLATLGFNQFLLATLLFIRSNLQGLHFFKSDSIISVTDRIIMAALVLYLFFSSTSNQFDIAWFAYIQTAGYACAVVLAFSFLLFHSSVRITPKFSMRFSLAYLKKCFPYALIGIFMLLYSFTDSVILERFRGEAEAGIYAQSSRLLLALINFSYLFSVPLLPMFARMLAKKENANELIQLSGSILILSSIFIALCCAWHAQDIISALYAKKENLSLIQKLTLSFKGELNNFENTQEIELSSKVFVITILNFIPMSAMYIYGTFLTAAGEMKLLNSTAALGVILNISANFLLIPHYGVEAAAIISLLTQSFVCAFQIAYARKKFNLHIGLPLMLKYALSIIIFEVSTFLLHQSTLSWIVQAVLTCSIGISSAILLKAIPLPHISKLFLHKS